jgi:hypothetical protein
VRFRLRGASPSSYWPLDESDVGAVVLSAELVRSLLELDEPAGVDTCKGVLCCDSRYLI